MAKGKKEPRERFEASLGTTLKNNWVEVGVDGLGGAGLGALGGMAVNQLTGVGSLGLDMGLGAGAGLLVGAAAGTAVCYQRETRLAEVANEVHGDVQATLDEVARMATLSSDARKAFAAAERFFSGFEARAEAEAKAAKKGGKAKQTQTQE